MRATRTGKFVGNIFVPCETWPQEKANARKERKFRVPRKRFKRTHTARA